MSSRKIDLTTRKMKLIEEREKAESDKKRANWIFCLYMAVALFGVVGAFYTTTIIHFVVLTIVSGLTFCCGLIILKYGTDNSIR